MKFDKNYKDIYSPEIKLTREGVATSEVSFSELYIIIEKKRKLLPIAFDKRDTFPFSIVQKPHLDGNIPLKFARTTSNCYAFVTLVNQFFEKLQKWSSKRNSIICMSKIIFGKPFKVSNFFAD